MDLSPLKKICQYNDDNKVQTLSVYYGIAIIGIELP